MSALANGAAYSRRQCMSIIFLVMLIGLSLFFFILSTVNHGPQTVVLLFGGIGFGVVVVLFGSLTVTVNPAVLKLSYGIGLISFRFAMSEIASCRPVRNRWWYGWGIRWFPGGILYNVAGFDAVEVVLRDGSVRRIGTPEPELLCDALVGHAPGIRRLERL